MKYLAIVYLFFQRLFTLKSPFAALSANPAYYLSALFQVSKSELVNDLQSIEGMEPASFEIVRLSSGLKAARNAHADIGRAWPVVVKPDIGERGIGVHICRDDDEFANAVQAQVEDFFVQKYVPGEEFGVFAIFPPGGDELIITIGHKFAPNVIGDGTSTLRDLIQTNYAHLASYLMGKNKDRLDHTPTEGEKVELDEILHGFRGTTQKVLDGDFSDTPLANQLRQFKALKNYNYGRFDYRADSVDELLAGNGSVLEVNGLAALPPVLSVPGHSSWEQTKILYRHWRHAFAIGDHNLAQGAKRYGFFDLAKSTYGHLAYRARYIRSKKRTN